jgi:hypothetical protein
LSWEASHDLILRGICRRCCLHFPGGGQRIVDPGRRKAKQRGDENSRPNKLALGLEVVRYARNVELQLANVQVIVDRLYHRVETKADHHGYHKSDGEDQHGTRVTSTIDDLHPKKY